MIADIKTLEFDLVLNEVSTYAMTTLAKDKILSMHPTNDAVLIEEMHQQTDELLVLLHKLGTPPLANVYNIYPHIKRLKLGGSLSAIELREILMHLVVVNQNKSFVTKAKSEQMDVTYYASIVEQMTYISDMETELRNAIDEDGNVLDTASTELANIRLKIVQTQQRVEERLHQFMASHANELNDAIITRRNGRFVVPVKVEYKNRVKGVIQDYSQSGETVFVEPSAVLELTNKIALLKGKEQSEMEKILHELSSHAAMYVDEFYVNLDLLIDLDVTTAKAEYARQLNCVKVEINEKIDLHQARHPLLDQKTVVANDITFFDYKAVIITGPNTGGKTVTLKTLGLMAMMHQTGLLLPVAEGSSLRIFDHIFADIGDEQSIEQSLSTFSSHMTNLIRITETLTTDSLILLDELGSGTDPKEGASLAIALVDFIKVRGTYLMATTHYPELKAYAYNELDTINASTEFNIDTLSPTYRLSIGIPGRSNAFEISRRLGLRDAIIEAAESQTATSDTEIANLIKKLEDETRKVQDIEMDLLDRRKVLKQREESLLDAERDLERKKESFQERLQDEARVYMDDVKKRAQSIIDELLTYQGEVKLHKLVEQKSKLNKVVQSDDREYASKDTKRKLAVGDMVFVLPYKQTAKVLKLLPNNQFEVKMGIMTTKVQRKDLEYVKPKHKTKITTSNVFYKKNKDISMELDLRGMRFEEAMTRVDKYIDQLMAAGLKQASIIHGHGTNALKTGVHELLKNSPYIESYAFGKEGEGGSGVTNIILK